MRSKIRELIQRAVAELQKGGELPEFALPDFSVEVPENPAHGDYATNAALLSAKPAGKKPMEVARAIAAALAKESRGAIARAEAAAPGFINVFLSVEWLAGQLSSFLETGGETKGTAAWKGKKAMVEFTDPNPFKEFHIGHLYSNSVGEAVARLFENAGAEVKRANYQGDVGLHVAKAVWGMQKKMAEEGIGLETLAKKNLEERVRFMGQAYSAGDRAFGADDAARQEIAALNQKIFALDPAVRELYLQGRGWSFEYFERIYRRLGTKFDFYYFERDAGEAGLKIVKENLTKGVFEESQGAIVFPGEKYGLHRRVFINSEGLPTYEAKELGLAPRKREDFPYDLSVIVTGNEIIDYFKVLLEALKRIYPDLAAKTIHLAHGMVRLRHGKMSSRSGEVVRAEDLLNEVKERVLGIMESAESKIRVAPEKREETAEAVAVGALKYSLLRIGLGSDITFDFEKSLSLEGDSGPYLQYTHARLKSILRKYGGEIKKLEIEKLELDAVEHRLLVTMLRLPEAICDALKDYAPSALANYLYNLAKLANEFYHSHPVIQEPDEAKRNLRIALVTGVALTLSKGLNLLGIDAPEEM